MKNWLNPSIESIKVDGFSGTHTHEVQFMQRQKRYVRLSQTNLEIFTHAAGQFHHVIIDMQCVLRPTCQDYQTLERLHRELIASIQSLTREPPPWTRLASHRK